MSPRPQSSIAPPWHTAALIALILAVAITGSLLPAGGITPSQAGLPPISGEQRLRLIYAPVLVVNGALTLYVSRVFRARNMLPELLGTGWRSLGRAATDLLLAVLGFVLISWLETRLAPAMGTGRNAALARLLPSTVAERLTWVLVSVSVGFCEEVVYRGYLQQQLSAASRSVVIGMGLSAVLFGIAHLEQGPAVAARSAVYGLLLGLLARWRRSLLPGIACHIGIDLRSAFL